MNLKISLSIIRDNNILPIRFKTKFVWPQMFIDIPITWLQTDYKNGINYYRLKLNESNNLVIETWKWNINDPDKKSIMECYIE